MTPCSSFQILQYGFVVSMILSLWPMIIPTQYLIRNNNNDGTFLELALWNTQEEEPGSELLSSSSELSKHVLSSLATRSVVGLTYALDLFPVLVTIPSGILRGSLRVRGLLPTCPWAGWLMVATAPMAWLVLFLANVLLLQVWGDAWLMVASLCLLTAPLLYLLRRRLYTTTTTSADDADETTEQQQQQQQLLVQTQRVIGGLTQLGIVLMVVWLMVTRRRYDHLFGSRIIPRSTIVRFVVSLVGRFLWTTVVFADMVLRLTVFQIQAEQHKQQNNNDNSNDNENVQGILISQTTNNNNHDDEDALVRSFAQSFTEILHPNATTTTTIAAAAPSSQPISRRGKIATLPEYYEDPTEEDTWSFEPDSMDEI